MKITVKVELYAMSYLISLARKSSEKPTHCAGPAHQPRAGHNLLGGAAARAETITEG